MPELPEVDTMVKKLRGWMKGGTIQSVRVLRQNGRYLPDGELELIDGKCEVQDITRVGKVIVFNLNRWTHWHKLGFFDNPLTRSEFVTRDGPSILIMTCHNAMSGFWDCSAEPWTFDYVEGARKAGESDVRVVFKMGSFDVRFHDARLFGSLRAFDPVGEWKGSKLPKGPDALVTACSSAVSHQAVVEDLVEGMGKKKLPIKHLLMDQELLAGVGNIYAAEALNAAGIDPRTPGNELSWGDYARLHECIMNILNRALESELKYDQYLQIYRREKCGRCGGPVTKTEIKGRSTYFCESCQVG